MKVAFAIGDRIELIHIKSAIGRKVSDKKYGSQVLDFDGDRTAKIAMHRKPYVCDGCYFFDTIEKISEEKILSFGLFVPNSLPDCSKRAV